MTINEKIVRNKVGLLNLAEELCNVSKACQLMGFAGTRFTATRRPLRKVE